MTDQTTMTDAPPRVATGRPSSFTPQIGDTICRRLRHGETLRKICRDDEMPDISTVMRWLTRDERFRAQYAHAREDQADYFAEELIDIVDGDDDPNRARVRMDARKWFASKVRPSKYGDRVALTGADGGPLQIQAVRFAEVLGPALPPLLEASRAHDTSAPKLTQATDNTQEDGE